LGSRETARRSYRKAIEAVGAITGQNGARVKPVVKVAVEGCKHKKPKRRKRHRNMGDAKKKSHATRR